ncbi:MAG: NfeD family protein [Acidimicrobiales bacterium]
MDEPLTWAIIWIVAGAVFGIGEMASPGSFFLAPFALGALAASLAGFLGAPILFTWFIFLIVSILSFLALRPLAKRLEADVPLQAGIGAHRLIGAVATVLEAIPAEAGATGLVRTGGEQWRADAAHNFAFGPGEQVRIVEVRGTSLIVEPIR